MYSTSNSPQYIHLIKTTGLAVTANSQGFLTEGIQICRLVFKICLRWELTGLELSAIEQSSEDRLNTLLVWVFVDSKKHGTMAALSLK